MRVIFVGMHNKPGMKPLDSKTKSGILIDKVAERCRREGMEVLKTNLFNIDRYPKKEEIRSLSFDWIERVELRQTDIIVLLGGCVHRNFPNTLTVKPIKIAHPASQWSHEHGRLCRKNIR